LAVIQRNIPWVMHAASLSQLIPLLAAARYGRKLPPARRWVAVWCLALLAGDAAQLWLVAPGTSNLWVQFLVVPLHTAILLWALSLWQQDPVSRLAFRLAIPLNLLALVALIPAVQATSFNRFAWALQALVLLAGSLYTLVRCSIGEPDRVTSRDWFWIMLGTSLFFSLRVALQPFVELVIGSNLELARLAYVVSAWTDILAYILIARGMLCPLPQAHSGRSS
jgi:hypothetical protein